MEGKSMKKKIIIVLIIAILIGGGLVAYYISNKEKTTPEDIWNQYISYIPQCTSIFDTLFII